MGHVSADAPALDIRADASGPFAEILTPAAIGFVARLCAKFESTRQNLLALRRERQARLDSGELPDFLPATRRIRETDWRVAPIPHDLRRRHVEITGPVDRKMVVNALNSGADCFMADFEDANSPTWANCIDGQINLRDAIRRQIDFTSAQSKRYRLNETTATLLVRPRGWHLDEKHVQLDGRPISASLFDFGLFFFHNARELLARKSGPYFYLPNSKAIWRRACGTTCSSGAAGAGHPARLDSRERF
jgi:malate synthase